MYFIVLGKRSRGSSLSHSTFPQQYNVTSLILHLSHYDDSTLEYRMCLHYSVKRAYMTAWKCKVMESIVHKGLSTSRRAI